jgi:hypothetical protein
MPQNSPRDARKQLDQQQDTSAKKNGQPRSGQKSPQDPARRMPKGSKTDEPKQDGGKRKDDVPAWAASLPPELRDAIAGGRGVEIPQQYKKLIERYLHWLQTRGSGTR